MTELPARMVELLAQIRAGHTSAQAALLAQIEHGRTLAGSYACVVDELPVTAPVTGPLAGIALAHRV